MKLADLIKNNIKTISNQLNKHLLLLLMRDKMSEGKVYKWAIKKIRTSDFYYGDYY